MTHLRCILGVAQEPKQPEEAEDEDGMVMDDEGLTCEQFIEVCIRLQLEGSATLLEALRKSLTATASSRRSF